MKINHGQFHYSFGYNWYKHIIHYEFAAYMDHGLLTTINHY